MTSFPQLRIPLALFDRYLAGGCTLDEVTLVEGWLREHPERQVVAHTLRSAPPVEIDVERNLGVVQGRLVSDGGAGQGRDASFETSPRLGKRANGYLRGEGFKAQPLRESVFKPQPLSRAIWTSIAVLSITVMVFLDRYTEHHQWPRHSDSAMLTYTTASGQRATITLPDGGTVALNVASRLDVPMDYLTGNRTVHLEGEGLFTIPHVSGAPFTVMAGTTATRVLGTSFVVRRYTTDTVTEVAVREGKVAVDRAIVTAAHLVDVGLRGVTAYRTADATQFSFATGILTLPSIPLVRAIPDLNRWYGADIRVDDPALANLSIAGQFNAGSLSDLVESLELLLPARIVKTGRTVTLYSEER